MKKVIAVVSLLFGLAGIVFATTPLGTNIGVSVTTDSVEVRGVNFDSENRSWTIFAEPVFVYGSPAETNGVSANLRVGAMFQIQVERAEIETALGITNLSEATVLQLDSTVNALAIQKLIDSLSAASNP